MTLASQPPPSSAITSVPTTLAANTPIVASGTGPLLPRTTGQTLESSSGGLLLSPASQVIPKKLVDKIRAGKFIELKELLQDNIALMSHLDDMQHGTSAVHVVGVSRPRLRDITSIAAWCHCFLAYVAAMTTDSSTRDQLAYARLVIKQAQCQGGLSFVDYDRAFRQHMAADPSLRWNRLNPELLASTSLGHRSTGTQYFCTLCRGVDHTRAQCALSFLEPPQRPAPQPPGSRPPTVQAPLGRGRPVCGSWNSGACAYEGRCNYQHVCRICFSRGHPAASCPRAGGKPPVTASNPAKKT